ncbi:MAG: DUF4198 domain-containing protein [Thermodesulfobacteriaceae bacterium]|nr:DUF4198 domain-containing protein [Thermodesulfobacteriaceae bacterium]MCX8042308.1 DUF4198 domain-containing protein [Thermodesulfobacteriaceae bacterium]MDW8135608.1 DUF4198 domain-containing protein [Thermodesulfobacterium sp.]
MFLIILFFLLFFFISFDCVLAYKIFLVSSEENYGKIGKEKNFYLGKVEPSFGILFDLKVPSEFFLLTPQKKREKITLLRREFKDPRTNVNKIGYELKLIPKEKGDHLICVETQPFLIPENKLRKAYLKTSWHVELEKGWDHLCGFELEIKPFTRPYGLKTGEIFWGQVWYKNQPLKEGVIEVEKFSPHFLTLEELPKDSFGDINYPLLKKKIRLAKNGFFVVNFEEPGWWVISIKVNRGTQFYGNQNYPLEIMTELWLYIFPSKREAKETLEYFFPKSN